MVHFEPDGDATADPLASGTALAITIERSSFEEP